jgi:glycosyltransferase involved in cell wall biosynthesis
MPANSKFFALYPNPVFVETGSFKGDGIQSALDAGFESIHSIELSEQYYGICQERFKDNTKVHLYLGDSATKLQEVIKNIDATITFWLDGHFSSGATAFGKVASPLMEELTAIAGHHSNTHTILIDDMRCWNVSDYGFDMADIKKKVLYINEAYYVGIVDSGWCGEDILIASPTPTTLSKYKVTAIVSAYNSSRFLRGCLDDLEAQTIAPCVEIIVVDSGSEEDEGEIVAEYQKIYPNIRYIRTERETVYGAWNRAVKVAEGRYLTNANTDDRHRHDAFGILSDMLDLHPDFALVYGDVLVTETPNETFYNNTTVGCIPYPNYNRQDLLGGSCLIGPQPMWRKAVHDGYGLFDADMVTSGDYEFWIRIAQTNKFYHVSQTLGLYMERADSVEHSNRRAQYLENKKITETYGKAAREDKAINRIDGIECGWSKAEICKLGIGIPLSFPWVPSSFFHSFVHIERPDFIYLHADNGPVSGLRNEIVKKALLEGCTKLIMMDVDQVYHPQTIMRLLSHNLPVVGALVHRRYPPFDSLMLKVVEVDDHFNGYESIDEWNEGELVEVDATGGGCLMFDMDIFKKLPYPWFRDDKQAPGLPNIGEDIGFCQDLKAAGYRIFVDTSIPAGHLAVMIINTATNRLYRAMQNEKQRVALAAALKVDNNKTEVGGT